jgi:hypothetical protein
MLAERNAAILRKHLGSKVPVSEGQGSWPGTVEIVDVNDANIVTLFTPSSFSSSSAWCAGGRELRYSECAGHPHNLPSWLVRFHPITTIFRTEGRARSWRDQWARLNGHEVNREEPDMLAARARMLSQYQRLLSEVVQRSQRAGQGSSRDAPMSVKRAC